jgi:hypothetical protein
MTGKLEKPKAGINGKPERKAGTTEILEGLYQTASISDVDLNFPSQ